MPWGQRSWLRRKSSAKERQKKKGKSTLTRTKGLQLIFLPFFVFSPLPQFVPKVDMSVYTII